MAQRKRRTASPAKKLTGAKRGHASRKKNTAHTSLLRFEIAGLALVFLGIFATLGTVGVDTGSAGDIVDGIFSYSFGIGRIIVSLSLIILGLKYIMVRKPVPVHSSWIMMALVFVFFLALIHLFFVPEGAEFRPILLRASGGILGGLVVFILRQFLGQAGAAIALVIAMVVTLMIWKKWSLSKGLNIVSDKAAEGIQEASHTIRQQWQERAEKKKIFDLEKEEAEFDAKREEHKSLPVLEQPVIDERPAQVQPEVEEILKEPAAVQPEPVTPVPVSSQVAPAAAVTEAPAADEDAEAAAAAPVSPAPVAYAAVAGPDEELADLKPIEIEKQPTAVDLAPQGSADHAHIVPAKPYAMPPLSFLQHGKQPSPSAADEVRDNARILQETLQSFNIDAKILHASQGPAVTRYELEPAAGVKVSKIVHLADDIALKLAATDVRIEAPIPGKAAIGIEVPNKQVTGVNLRDVLDADEFQRASGGVPVGLGMDIAGNPVIADLTKMPHLLVAGSTGSGKSVCINTLIASILFKQRPEKVKLILIDPKVVELSNYNGIPHLMTPVVTDAKKAASVLRWAVREMDQRYRRFAETGTRDLARYNSLHPEEAFPFVVIIIDELADLMMVASSDVEDSICRLAQKARACGMHLVLATQRPSVDVLTGIIKANVPSRISFAVSSQIDSRTILDMAGAEKLLGKGDMLFYPMGASKPIRVQGAFISDSEIDKTVSFIQDQCEPDYDETVVQAQNEENNGAEDLYEDELLEQAVDMILETGQASASMLQRRFRIGYTRAARLIDTMEAMRIVGPNNGSKPREILMPAEEVHKKYFSSQPT